MAASPGVGGSALLYSDSKFRASFRETVNASWPYHTAIVIQDGSSRETPTRPMRFSNCSLVCVLVGQHEVPSQLSLDCAREQSILPECWDLDSEISLPGGRGVSERVTQCNQGFDI